MFKSELSKSRRELNARKWVSLLEVQSSPGRTLWSGVSGAAREGIPASGSYKLPNLPALCGLLLSHELTASV